ncbi:hypothetical protein Henu3_gp9 [Mycobacterium phage Henu3]|uniref:Uncharacterized protein n=1 Tax=Mycobacterium phage Henu3 TaxID=2492961 RepID=A0A410T7P2_9CAUD|nr:hypothetical protein I5G68_gp08 [Mycobacterium phage Henu3]QAU04956.1 hypothetical protein Henu3_gp9 [Mycobacterium phage Henu3]
MHLTVAGARHERLAETVHSVRATPHQGLVVAARQAITGGAVLVVDLAHEAVQLAAVLHLGRVVDDHSGLLPRCGRSVEHSTRVCRHVNTENAPPVSTGRSSRRLSLSDGQPPATGQKTRLNAPAAEHQPRPGPIGLDQPRHISSGAASHPQRGDSRRIGHVRWAPIPRVDSVGQPENAATLSGQPSVLIDADHQIAVARLTRPIRPTAELRQARRRRQRRVILDNQTLVPQSLPEAAQPAHVVGRDAILADNEPLGVIAQPPGR